MSGKRSGETEEVGGGPPAIPDEVGSRGRGSCRAGGVVESPTVPQAEGPDEEAGEGLEQPPTKPEVSAGRGKPDKGGVVP